MSTVLMVLKGSRSDLATDGSPEMISIFAEPWWLEAAAGERLERAEVRWGDGVVASFPFVRERQMGFTLLDMPPYTRTLGPILTLPESKPAKRLRNMHDAVAQLIAALPKHDRFQTMLGPEDASAFSLLLSGCTLGQSFTFRMPGAWDDEQHWNELDQKTRNLIRSAARELEVERSFAMDPVLALASQERGREDRTDRATLERLGEAARVRNCMITLTARKRGGAVVAAATLVWDSRVLYFWQSSRDAAAARSGANSLLVWEAMLLARSKGLIFDVDGYHSLSSARFVARFGMQTTTRTSVMHLSGRGRMVQAAGRLLGRGGGVGVQPIVDTLS